MESRSKYLFFFCLLMSLQTRISSFRGLKLMMHISSQISLILLPFTNEKSRVMIGREHN